MHVTRSFRRGDDDGAPDGVPPLRGARVGAWAGRRFGGDTSGATAVEYALVAIPFLGLLLGALQMFLVLQSQQMLETAAETAGRMVLTGNAQSLTQTAFKNAVCAAIPAFVRCSGVMVDLQVATSFAGSNTSKPTLTYDNQGNVTNAWVFQPGNPGDIVVLRIIYQAPMISIPGLKLATQTNGSRLIMATSVFKNEAFQ